MNKYLVKFTFIFFLLTTFTHFAQTNTCGTVVNDTFDNSGTLPSEWTEYNTSGNFTVDSGQLIINHNTSKPSAYRDFTAISENVTFNFDVSSTKNYVRCQVNLMSSTGQYVASIDIGAKSTSIKYATSLSSGSPSGYTDASPKVEFFKNTLYSISAHIDFSNQTINYYANNKLMMENVPFLESVSDIEKIDIQSIYMYNNSGNFNFDNITLYTSNAHRLLSEEVIIAQDLLDSAIIGTAIRQYTQNDFDVFKTAINTAILVEENCSANQIEVNNALETLKVAIAHFKASAVPFDGTVNINVLNTKQKIIMMGGDMERNAAHLQQAPNKEEIVDWLVKDIPFNTYRVKYDKTQEMEEGELDLDGTYANQVLSMKMILEASPNIKFFATMKSDYHGYSQGNRNNLPTFIYDYGYDNTTETYFGTKVFDAVKYGYFLADYVEYMSQNGVPISYLSTSKEWTQVMTTTRAKLTIETLINVLAERGIDMPLIIDPGAWSITQGYNTVNSYVSKNVNQYVYGYSTHNYSKGSKTWSDFVTAANNARKIAVDDESGHGSGGPTNGVYEPAITTALSTYANKCDMYGGGIQGEIFFELWMNNFTYGRPIMFTSTTVGRRIRSYYLMQKFTQTVFDATYVNQTLNNFEDVKSMAFIKDDKLVIWMINNSELDYSGFSVDVSNLGLKEGMTVQQVYWNPTSVITGAENNIVANSDNQFKVNMTPNSINCFIVSPKDALSTENYLESKVKMYPNPVSDKLMISGADVEFKQYRIYNINGQVIKENKVDSKEFEIDVRELPKGVYILKLENSDTTITRKIVKN